MLTSLWCTFSNEWSSVKSVIEHYSSLNFTFLWCYLWNIGFFGKKVETSLSNHHNLVLLFEKGSSRVPKLYKTRQSTFWTRIHNTERTCTHTPSVPQSGSQNSAVRQSGYRSRVFHKKIELMCACSRNPYLVPRLPVVRGLSLWYCEEPLILP